MKFILLIVFGIILCQVYYIIGDYMTVGSLFWDRGGVGVRTLTHCF